MGGETARPEDMKNMLDYIRFQIRELHGARVAEDIRVLYGGSVDDHDARAYLEIDGCDGVLVGAASLNYSKFARIVDSAYQMHRQQKAA